MDKENKGNNASSSSKEKQAAILRILLLLYILPFAAAHFAYRYWHKINAATFYTIVIILLISLVIIWTILVNKFSKEK